MYILHSLNPDTRGIYFAATGFPADIGRNSRGDLRAPRPTRRRDLAVERGRHLQRYLVGSEYVLRVPRNAPPFVAAIVGKYGLVAGLECEPLPDPRPKPDELASAGYFTAEEVRWLSGWLDLLAPFALAPLPKRFRHGDLQTTNVMVRPGSPTYLALIDWGVCGWGSSLRFRRHTAQGGPFHAPGLSGGGSSSGRRDSGGQNPVETPADLPLPSRTIPAAGTLVGRAPGGDAARDHALLPRFAWQAVEGSVPSSVKFATQVRPVNTADHRCAYSWAFATFSCIPGTTRPALIRPRAIV